MVQAASKREGPQDDGLFLESPPKPWPNDSARPKEKELSSDLNVESLARIIWRRC